ncbi:MAG: DUF1559 domain-containing protein [bacterium]|nr:DUF1559 domain-containing protein [bacterium]
MLPALSQAREKARQAVCMNNLKQIHLGAMMYAEDYGEWLPTVEVSSPQSFLYSFLCHLEETDQWVNYGKLYSLKYLPLGVIFVCPSAPKVTQYGLENPNWIEKSWRECYYRTLRSSFMFTPHYKLSRIKPTNVMALHRIYYYYNVCESRHLGMCNVLFIGGDVRPIKESTIISLKPTWPEDWNWTGFLQDLHKQ